jgi:hypothetical protein
MIYAVLAISTGTYIFDLSATQQGSDVTTELGISETTQGITPTPTVGQGGVGMTASAGLVAGTPVQFRESYDLFYDRVEALLGSKTWLTCGEVREGTSDRYYDALCLLADDKIPENVRLSARTEQYLAKVKQRQDEERRARHPCQSDAQCVEGGICFDGLCRR